MSISMKTFFYFLFFNEILNNCKLVYVVGSSSTNEKQTFLMTHKTNDIFLRRYKRYLVFEKGASLFVQANIAKSIIPPAPRGLNMITEFTVNYELPTDFHIFQKKQMKTTKKPVPTTTIKSSYSHDPYYEHYDTIVPYNHDYYFKIHPEYLNNQVIQRKYSSYSKKKMLPRKCFKRNFYDYNRKLTSICLNRGKRNEEAWSIDKLTVSERMFYDLIEKWSLLHGFLPRYCFMRTLCESSELLLPYGYSLLHDIIHILVRYTKPWAFHHKIFGRSLRQPYPIDECAKLYGPYCRVSWLDFITNAVYGTRAVDFMR